MSRIRNMPLNRSSAVTAIFAASIAVFLAALPPFLISNDPPPQLFSVRHLEGLLHGFLVLRSQQGEVLANGESIQTNLGNRVSIHVFFHFKDGSVSDETTVFSQRRTFRFLSDHLIQKGPAFKRPLDVMIDGAKSQVTVRYTDDGKEKVSTEHIDVPPDLGNGLVITLLKNLPPNSQRITIPYLAATPKPRMVKLEITPQGEDPFAVGELTRKVTHYLVKVQIGGVAGVVAPLVGKQPPDIHLWVLGGNAPAWIRSEGPLCDECPIWRVELVSPAGPKDAPKESENKNTENKKPEDKKPENKNSENKPAENKKAEPKP
jgi:hypothetical protein